MTPAAKGYVMTEQLDDLELELRQLDGVVAVGCVDVEGTLVVQVATATPARVAPLYRQASELVAAWLGSDAVVEVRILDPLRETNGQPEPVHLEMADPVERIRLSSVTTAASADSVEVEVILTYRGAVVSSRQTSPNVSTLVSRAAAAAVLDALGQLLDDVPPVAVDTATSVELDGARAVVVSILQHDRSASWQRLCGTAQVHGAAHAEAAARAALAAVNRRIAAW